MDDAVRCSFGYVTRGVEKQAEVRELRLDDCFTEPLVPTPLCSFLFIFFRTQHLMISAMGIRRLYDIVLFFCLSSRHTAQRAR